MAININTIEDLMRALDENPEWLEAMRARLLTRELLELPQKFSQLTDRVDQLTDRVDLLAVRMDQLTDRMDQLTVRMDQLTAELNQFMAATNRRFDVLETEVKRHSVDIGQLKGLLARNIIIDEAALVARVMGFRRIRNLPREELWDLTEASDISDISTDDIRSFRKADLVVEATNRQGETCHIAVEISYTVDERDTSRALRNADFLTKFTGIPAYAAVSGLQLDSRIQSSIDSGEVFWHQMDPEILNPE